MTKGTLLLRLMRNLKMNKVPRSLKWLQEHKELAYKLAQTKETQSYVCVCTV